MPMDKKPVEKMSKEWMLIYLMSKLKICILFKKNIAAEN
jgi:hypothetical protein